MNEIEYRNGDDFVLAKLESAWVLRTAESLI